MRSIQLSCITKQPDRVWASSVPEKISQTSETTCQNPKKKIKHDENNDKDDDNSSNNSGYYDANLSINEDNEKGSAALGEALSMVIVMLMLLMDMMRKKGRLGEEDV